MSTNIQRYHVYHIRSADRTSGNENSFRIHLSHNPDLDPNENYVWASISDAQIPNSFYAITSANNEFEFNTVQKLITPGNYSANELVTELDRLIQSTVATVSTSYDDITGKFSFADSNNSLFVIDFSVAGGITAPANIVMGFAKASYTATADTPSAGTSTITAVNVANIVGDHTLYLNTSLATRTAYSSNVGTFSATLAKIPIGVGAYEIIDYTAPEHRFRAELSSKVLEIHSLDISLKNSNGSVIDLNGLDWEFTLVLESIKKDLSHAHEHVSKLPKNLA